MFINGSYKVVVAGVDVTSRFQPHLLSLEVTKSAGEATDSLSINLSDQEGQLFLPQDRAPITVVLNGEQVFEGFVSEVNCSISKGGGRTMSITGSSADQGSKIKEPALRHKDDASLSAVAQEWGSKAGLSVQVAGSISSVTLPYWIMQHESFISWGQRTAREVGATFKVIGSRAFFTARNEGLSISGKKLTSISAAVGTNLIDGEITPIISRPKFKKSAAKFFDKNEGAHVEVEAETGVEGVEVKLSGHFRQASEGKANSKAQSEGKESDREQGSGSVTILGNPAAEPEAECNVSGWRSGIDGTYRINSVTHSVEKGGGFTTSLDLKQPKGSAGKDAR